MVLEKVINNFLLISIYVQHHSFTSKNFCKDTIIFLIIKKKNDEIRKKNRIVLIIREKKICSTVYFCLFGRFLGGKRDFFRGCFWGIWKDFGGREEKLVQIG